MGTARAGPSSGCCAIPTTEACSFCTPWRPERMTAPFRRRWSCLIGHVWTSGSLDTTFNYCAYFSDPSNNLDAISGYMLEVVSEGWCTDRPKKFLGIFKTGDVTKA